MSQSREAGTVAIQMVGEPRLEGEKVLITIRGNTPGEVGSTEARTYAQQVARQFMIAPGNSEMSGPYAIDPETGAPYVNPLSAFKPGSWFQQDFKFQGRL
jgi:hypothetical protein